MGVRTRGLDIKAGAAKLKADKTARLEAELVIDRWNRRLAPGRDMPWSPTIRAALVAGTPWLDIFCPACGTDRHGLDRRNAKLFPRLWRRWAFLHRPRSSGQIRSHLGGGDDASVGGLEAFACAARADPGRNSSAALRVKRVSGEAASMRQRRDRSMWRLRPFVGVPSQGRRGGG